MYDSTAGNLSILASLLTGIITYNITANGGEVFLATTLANSVAKMIMSQTDELTIVESIIIYVKTNLSTINTNTVVSLAFIIAISTLSTIYMYNFFTSTPAFANTTAHVSFISQIILYANIIVYFLMTITSLYGNLFNTIELTNITNTVFNSLGFLLDTVYFSSLLSANPINTTVVLVLFK